MSAPTNHNHVRWSVLGICAKLETNKFHCFHAFALCPTTFIIAKSICIRPSVESPHLIWKCTKREHIQHWNSCCRYFQTVTGRLTVFYGWFMTITIHMLVASVTDSLQLSVCSSVVLQHSFTPIGPIQLSNPLFMVSIKHRRHCLGYMKLVKTTKWLHAAVVEA